MKNKKPSNKTTRRLIRTKGFVGNPEWLGREFKELTKKLIKNKKTSQRTKRTKKVTLELHEKEFESVLDALNRIQKYVHLKSENIKLNKELSNLDKKLDDKAWNELIAIEWAKKAIPPKGAKIKDYQEAALRIGIDKPKRGKRPTYDANKVLEYHKIVIKTLIEKNQTLSGEQKKTAVHKVVEEFEMPNYDSARKYLTRQNAENLPFSD
jgi:hypothetical protein